ncbi:MAG: ECF-type sigma factor [Bryobacteraceae bacterium]
MSAYNVACRLARRGKRDESLSLLREAGRTGQFFQVAARMMRRVLVDHARQHRRVKRGGSVIKV